MTSLAPRASQPVLPQRVTAGLFGSILETISFLRFSRSAAEFNLVTMLSSHSVYLDKSCPMVEGESLP